MTEYRPYPPEDLDEFWHAAVAEAMARPLDYRRSLKNEFDLHGFTVELIEFQGMVGRVHGWLAYPEGARRLPGFIWVPPYGRESLLPNEYGTRVGFTSLSLNLHGLGAFHQEKYAVDRGYFSEGAVDPESWIFRRMFQDCVIAFRVLQAQNEADEDRLAAMGMSQGAGISIWLGAWCNIVKAVCADMPFLSAIKYTLEKHIYRYPLKELTDFMDNVPLGHPRVNSTLAYFDTMNQATRCQVPTQVSLGLKDPAVRPESAEATFNALPGNKRLLVYEGGHDWDPGMIENNRQWLLENLR
jgi:cephalosporin-C deacetylase